MPRRFIVLLFVVLGGVGTMASGARAAHHAAGTTPALGPVPRTCPHGPRPTAFDPATAPGVGRFPLWAVGFLWGVHGLPTPPATLTYGGTVPAGAFTPAYGWGHKFLWVSKISVRGKITVQGGELHGAGSLFFDDGDTPMPTRTLVLDPPHPLASSGNDPSWSYFPSTLYFPHAGCYSLVARWPGGGWHVTFAAGR